MPTKQLIVIGAGMGGLSAAIHARLLGRDVLVLEKGASSGGKAAGISIAGYELDPGPSIIILTEIYAKVFERAGRKMEDYLQFRRLDTISRVFFEGSEPLDLPAGSERSPRLGTGSRQGDVRRTLDLFRPPTPFGACR